MYNLIVKTRITEFYIQENGPDIYRDVSHLTTKSNKINR